MLVVEGLSPTLELSGSENQIPIPFRPHVQALGLTVLIDARMCSPSSSLFWGLSQLQVSVGLWPQPFTLPLPRSTCVELHGYRAELMIAIAFRIQSQGPCIVYC